MFTEKDLHEILKPMRETFREIEQLLNEKEDETLIDALFFSKCDHNWRRINTWTYICSKCGCEKEVSP